MNRALTVLGALYLAGGCTKPSSPPPQAPPPKVNLSPQSVWKARAEGTRLAFETDQARVYVQAAPRNLDLGLPGVTLGDARGPRYGLLGGYFAPLLLAPDSQASYVAEVTSRGPLGLRVVLRQAAKLALDATIFPPKDDIVSVRIDSPASVVVSADRTPVQGTFESKPSFLTSMSSGDDPKVEALRATRVEANAKPWNLTLAIPCPRIQLVHPVPKGSTSVFVMHTGPTTVDDDLYAPKAERHPDLDACTATHTSTLSVGWPPGKQPST